MSKKIVIESMFLYRYDDPGLGITVGGSQRYALDLGYLFHKLGYEVTFLTKANRNMKEHYNGWANIVAFDSPYGERGRFNFSKRVYLYCKEVKTDIACYSDLEIGFPYCFENSFALQHGIAWDNPHGKLKKWLNSYLYIKAVQKFQKVICVDTNFINWCRERAESYFENPEKLTYIPNYADETQFAYSYKEWKAGQTFRLLYPRRLVAHRGYDIFLEMCKLLIERGHSIKPILAFEDFKDINFKRKYPRYSELNCEIVHPGLNEIHNYYKDAYLSFIPSRWSEGTSLSAIEAMSVGCPVIVSDVGGLGNVVLPGFNGYIVPPSVENFVSMAEPLLNDVNKRNELAKNCGTMNQIFGKNRWEKQVVKTVSALL